MYFHHNKINDFRERREAEQRERDRQEKERMEKERLQREHRERQERERQERERQREKQLSAVEAVDHHFQLSMELAKKVSSSPKIFRYYPKKFLKYIHFVNSSAQGSCFHKLTADVSSG